MPPALSQLKRTVSALLPVSILWVFAACVLICGWEHTAAHGEPHFASAASTAEAADRPASQGCPDAALLKAANTERITLQPASQAVSGLPVSIKKAGSSTGAATRLYPHRPQLQTDLPQNLLPALRI